MKLFKIAGKNLTVQERSLMHRNQPKSRTSLSGAYIHLRISNQIMTPFCFICHLFIVQFIRQQENSLLRFFSFITYESTRVHIYWGLQSEGTMPLQGNRGQICFFGSWRLRIPFTPTIAVQMASQGICTSLQNKKAIKALGMKRKIGLTLMF